MLSGDDDGRPFDLIKVETGEERRLKEEWHHFQRVQFYGHRTFPGMLLIEIIMDIDIAMGSDWNSFNRSFISPIITE